MLKQPSSQVKMTNVATIRYKINNKIFQIACYRNKAVNWRNGVQEDITEVLQIDQIYQNASHGIIAKKSDLNKFFANKTKKEIIQVILERGELQVSDKERQSQTANILADIIKIIVEKCVHPITKRRFTPETIKLAIREIHFPLKTDQNAKKQALDCIKMLQKRYKIARGEMKIKITFEKDFKDKIEKCMHDLQIEAFQSEQEKAESISRIYNIQPSRYREINQALKQLNVIIEVLVGVIVNEEHKDLEVEEFSALELLQQFQSKQYKEEEIEEKNYTYAKKEEKNEEKLIRCTTCGGSAVFGTAQDQRQHFKCEWHVENVKRKSKHLHALTEEEFRIEVFNKEFH